MIIVNGWKPLTIITKNSILDFAAPLDLPLKYMKFCARDIYESYMLPPRDLFLEPIQKTTTDSASSWKSYIIYTRILISF